MRVLVTGATGYVGSAIVRALVQAGHEVTGLVRNGGRAAVLSKLGAKPALGDLSDSGLLTELAGAADGVIHAAFAYGTDSVSADRTATESLLAGMGPGCLVYTSGVWVLGSTGDAGADEDTPVSQPAVMVAWRPAHERMVLEAGARRLATAVVRPGLVYGGLGGIVGQVFDSAVETGAAAFVGDGENRWSMVHRDDLGELYRRILEEKASGIFHGVDGAAVPVREVARAASLAAGTGGSFRSVPLAEARKQAGPFADALCLDQVVRASRSTALGWRPAHPPFPESAAAAFAERGPVS